MGVVIANESWNRLGGGLPNTRVGNSNPRVNTTLLLIEVSIASESSVCLTRRLPATVTVIISGKPTANEGPFGGAAAGVKVLMGAMADIRRHLHCSQNWLGYFHASSHQSQF